MFGEALCEPQCCDLLLFEGVGRTRGHSAAHLPTTRHIGFQSQVIGQVGPCMSNAEQHMKRRGDQKPKRGGALTCSTALGQRPITARTNCGGRAGRKAVVRGMWWGGTEQVLVPRCGT